jgi:hypothetical protein
VTATTCVFCKRVHEISREEAFEILRKTPDALRLLLDAVNVEDLNKKPGDSWSARQLLVHLIDVEYIYGFRYRFIMAEKDPVVPSIDQNLWSDTFSYGDLDGTQLIRAFTPIRRVNLELLQTVDPGLFDKPAQHPEFGKITVGMMIPHQAAHDQNHLQQIRDRIPVV